MISTLAPMFLRSRRAMMLILGLGALTGGGIFAASGQSVATIEPPAQEQVIREQVSSSQGPQTKLMTEPDQPQTTASAITPLRQQRGFAQDEIARLAQDRTQVLPRSPAARPPLAASSSAVRQPQNRVSQAALVARAPASPPQAPARPTRTAVAKPGPSLLVAQAGK
jgi:hypothetical protein